MKGQSGGDERQAASATAERAGTKTETAATTTETANTPAGAGTKAETAATKAETAKTPTGAGTNAEPAATKAETAKRPTGAGTKAEPAKTPVAGAKAESAAAKAETAVARAETTVVKVETAKRGVEGVRERGDAGAAGEEAPGPRTRIGDELLAETAQSKARGDAGVRAAETSAGGRREPSTEGVSPEPERPPSVGRIARSEPTPERESPIGGERLPIPGAEIGIPSARVRRFVDSGGATLEARLVDIDTGNAIANADIEAWMGTKSVEAQSDAEGRFKIEGLVPGSRINLWITAAPAFVQERTEVAVPGQRPEFQATFRMLSRSAISGAVDGGAGLFLTRRGSRTVVTGLAAFGPAERGGVRVGDAIVSVGKRKVGDLGPGAIDYLLRGPIGSQVEISVQTGSDPPRTIVLQRSAR